jgi:hypothetical protein
MQLGGISDFRFVPEWKGNRDLDEGERLSLTIIPLRSADVLEVVTDEQALAWRDGMAEALEPYADVVAALKRQDADTLRMLKVIHNHTSGYRNFYFGTKKETTPLVIFLHPDMPMPSSLVDLGDNLMLEIYGVIGATSGMTGDELKNSVGLYDGTNLPTTANREPSSSATDVSEEEHLRGADTPIAETESPSS